MRKLTRERGPWITEGRSDRGDGQGDKRPLVVVVEPRGVRLRPKGCRTGSYFITWETIYLRGQSAAAGFETRPAGGRSIKRGTRA